MKLNKMVISKRKKDVKEAPQALPVKRTKIQAQRKFAQGQQPPSSAYLSYLSTNSNQELLDVAAKEKSPEKDILPVRPTTEDFLTFLCFRGTNSLPKELDFDNSTYNQPSTSKSSPQKKSATENNKEDKKKTPNNKKSDVKNSSDVVKGTKKNEKNNSTQQQSQPEIDPKTGFIPFAVRKRAEMHPAKVEKRNHVNKKGGNGGKKDDEKVVGESSVNAIADVEKSKTTQNSKKNVENKKSTTAAVEKEKEKPEKRFTRNSTFNISGTFVPSTSTPKNIINESFSDDEPLIVKSEPKMKKTKVEVENLNNTDSKVLKKNSNDTNESQQPPQKSNRGRKKKVVVEEKKDDEKEEIPKKKSKAKSQQDLSSQTENSENEGTRGRPMRKTKEAATIYMELIGRKLTLHDSSDNDSSLDSLEVPNLKRVELLENELKAKVVEEKGKSKPAKKQQQKSVDNESQSQVKKVLDKSFSDSDEEPLASKVKKPTKSVGKKRGRKSNQELAEIALKKSKEAQNNSTKVESSEAKQNSIQQQQQESSTSKPISKKVEEILKTKKENLSVENELVEREQAQNSSSPAKDSINLLPSKEESEKIFGIASVTLAQSCGPLDTKCTLGKCGSMHSLKPPVAQQLTESALGSPKDRRKSKVNMTRDQIQKWLEESSWTPIPNDDMEVLETRTNSKPPSSVGFSKSGEDSQSSSNIKEKCDQSSSVNSKTKDQKSKKESTSTKLFAKLNEKIKSTFSIKEEKKTNNMEVVAKVDLTQPETTTKNKSEKKTPVYNQSPQQQQQRRTPVYNKPETKPTPKLTPMLPKSLGAFSPENEHSIYSFDREDEELPATPFRRHNSKSDENVKATPTKQSTSASHVSLSLSPDENKKTAAISIDLLNNLKKTEKQQTTVIENAEKDEDSDSEGHTFYIPLQASNASGSKTIQGVAVKLGTEGEEGPNQRIIMHAKLVTKSRSNATPLPESMSNVQDLVKTLIASKEISKSVPCATVQPRFKSSESSENHQEASTSGSNTRTRQQQQQQQQQTPKQGMLHEAPVFRPTESEFADPIEYIERITPIASPYGICRIIPPDNFKPECRISDEMRFNAYNQYVHKMLHRWGPSAKEFSAIKKYLATQSIVFQRPPLIAGIEVDLPRLYHTVQELGGLKEVIEKKKWVKVAEEMCIPKTAHDRVTKLDDIYCKYLLPYDTLSQNERQKLFDEVEAEWSKKEAKARRNADKTVESEEQSNDDSEESEEEEDDDASMECMVKGRSMALSQFYRVARNMLTLWFKTPEPPVSEIEAEYWRHVAVRDSHVCVHYGSIDSSGYGYGFPMPGPKTKSSPCSKHPWNLKVLTNNQNSILRSLGPVMGVTIPTLHVGMLFSAVCWYRDPHGLPWIEYLHTGSSKIWYAVPDSQSQNFRNALTSLVPSHCQNKTIWLPCDTTMVPPYMLTDRNVSLCRTEQQPGQFVCVFPRAYTSSVCTGYTVSESVYFATNSWLDTAHLDFKDIQESCEPTMFSLEQLLFAIANDQRSKDKTVRKILPMLEEVYETEKKSRDKLKKMGINKFEKIHESKTKVNAEELECNYCRANLHISWIKLCEDDEENVYCLNHSIKYLEAKRIQANQCKLLFTYTIEEIEKLIKKLKSKTLNEPSSSSSQSENSKNIVKSTNKSK